MMQDSEVIKLVKPVPSDRLATQVLVAWYHTVRPRWKKPLDLAITAFFVLMALYSFSLRPLPLFAWLSLAGALMAIILSWFYVPFLAKAALAAKTNLRVLVVPLGRDLNKLELKRVGGGLLVQTADDFTAQASGLKVVTKVQPTAQQIEDLLFAERVAKFVKSNAIVFCGGGMTLGVGAGQMSRVDSTKIASIKATNAGLSLKGSVVASDAFFPFRDGLDVLAEAGATAVIQPGGSMRDEEVIAAADEHGIAMVVTGVRHFRH